MPSNKKIGIFDSGIGGINVLKECIKILPDEHFIYLLDRAYFPYGSKTTDQIQNRSIECANLLLDHDVKAIVVACNTATAAGIEKLRKYTDVPVIGLEPAVKPAYESLTDGRMLVLVTSVTYQSEKFKTLMNKYSDKTIAVVSLKNLALDIEKNIYNLEKIRPLIFEILKDYDDAQSVVLGCSHYCFVKRFIYDYFNGRTKIFDGCQGVANQLRTRLQNDDLLCDKRQFTVEFFETV